VEGETGKHVWAERYDRDLPDIFAMQDEITEAVTIAIAPAIAKAEQRRAMRKPPASLDAWAASQRGLWHLGRKGSGDEGHRNRAGRVRHYVRERPPWMRPEDHTHMLEGLRKAGWGG
jgi:hypothetical protein